MLPPSSDHGVNPVSEFLILSNILTKKETEERELQMTCFKQSYSNFITLNDPNLNRCAPVWSAILLQHVHLLISLSF